MKRYAGVVTVLLLVVGSMAAAPREREEVVRTQRLVVVDSAGQERIVLAAPIGTPSRRVPSTGMAVRGPDGAERMAMGVKTDGSVSMGLDATPGVGDPRNRERMNLIAHADGRAQIRFLDDQTRIQGRIMADTAGAMWLQFLDWSEGDVVDYIHLDETSLKRLLQVIEAR